MSWTEERVERLSRLWLEGRSASQIAAELGEGVTRNAVIGKVHRLGLSGRDPAPVEAPQLRAKAPAAAEPIALPPILEDVVSEIEVPPAPQPIAIDLQVLRTASDVVIPLSDRVTILELGATMCRWPLGDPTSAEFRFCGCRSHSSLPYCAEHARVAFQPVADRRRVERMARIA